MDNHCKAQIIRRSGFHLRLCSNAGVLVGYLWVRRRIRDISHAKFNIRRPKPSSIDLKLYEKPTIQDLCISTFEPTFVPNKYPSLSLVFPFHPQPRSPELHAITRQEPLSDNAQNHLISIGQAIRNMAIRQAVRNLRCHNRFL